MNWPKIITAVALKVLLLFFSTDTLAANNAVGATFKIERLQASSCERSRRFKEFLFLAATLADQITNISISYNPEFQSCLDVISQSLRRINLPVVTNPIEKQKDALIITIILDGENQPVETANPDIIPDEKKQIEDLALEKSKTEDVPLEEKSNLELSLPFIIKLAAGYTLLTPLPDEQVRDRPTVEATIRTQPFIPDYFFMGSTSVSLKTGSKLPWAVIASGMLATDLFYLRDNISVPFGLGIRAFKAKVNKQNADSVKTSTKNIVIPEQVLGPIAQVGIAYRSGLLTADAQLAVTPIMAANSPLITTFNASVMLGYQLTAADSLIINTLRHDVRYPTIDSYVKVIVASITIGYQRDLL